MKKGLEFKINWLEEYPLKSLSLHAESSDWK